MSWHPLRRKAGPPGSSLPAAADDQSFHFFHSYDPKRIPVEGRHGRAATSGRRRRYRRRPMTRFTSASCSSIAGALRKRRVQKRSRKRGGWNRWSVKFGSQGSGQNATQSFK